jgi:excisionase family DNA binding protein
VKKQRARELMTVAEVAQLLNVTRGYIMQTLLRKHVMQPVFVIGGRRYVLRSKAEAYYVKRRRIARRALRQLARVSQEAAVHRDAPNADMTDSDGHYVAATVLTTVSVFLGDCSGDSLPLVCTGTATGPDATVWRPVALALRQPSPRGPYPVGSVFTIFVHNTSPADSRVLSTLRIDVVCREGLAYASVQSANPRFDLEPVAVVIGDDVVTIARKIVASVE